jgi:hypothetical protein
LAATRAPTWNGLSATRWYRSQKVRPRADLKSAHGRIGSAT